MKKAFPPAFATSAAALVTLLLAEVLTGWVLHTAYQPAPEHAYASVEAMRAQPWLGFLRSFHYWGSAWLLAHSFLHVSTLLLAGAYEKPNQWRWVAAVTVFACAWILQITGNLLPFDRHAVQTVNVEASIAGRIPLIGPDMTASVLGGEAFGARTLEIWYLVHRWVAPLLAMLMLFAAFLAYAGQRETRHSKLIAATPLLLISVFAFFVRPPLGSPAGAEDFASMNALVNWYNWPLHGALRAFESILPTYGWIGAILLPLLLLVFLFALPVIAERTTGMLVSIVFVAFILVFLLLAVLFGGPVAPLTGDRDRGIVDLAAQVAPPPSQAPPFDARLAEWGRRHFNDVGCGNCHGTDARHPSAGPDLMASDRRRPDPEYYIRYIRDPRSVNPASTMPAFSDLREAQFRAIAEFLRSRE